jgi:hypothetical protein
MNEVNFYIYGSLFALFFIYSIIVGVTAKLLPMTSGHSTFLLLGGNPKPHNVYKIEDLMINFLPLLGFSISSFLFLFSLEKQPQIA